MRHSHNRSVSTVPESAPGVSHGLRRLLPRLAPVCLLLAVAVGHAQTVTLAADAQPARAAEVARIVTGIMSFTRWPTARNTLRLCIVTPALYADLLADRTADLQSRTIVTLRYPADNPRIATDCDVVYIEPIEAAAREHLFQRLAGQPVLSVGDTDDACAMGGLFCLTSGAGAISFAANLDAIARSGLRINPKVLLLARTREPAR